MPEFTSDDLIFKNYSPTVDGGDNPKYIGVLDRIKVDKTEEYEVVYFCNQFVKNYTVPKTKESFQKVERLLRLPEIQGEDNRAKLNALIAQNWSRIR